MDMLLALTIHVTVKKSLASLLDQAKKQQSLASLLDQAKKNKVLLVY